MQAGALVLLLIGAVAALLPVSYSVGLIATFSTVMRWVIYAVVQIAFLVLFLISYVIYHAQTGTHAFVVWAEDTVGKWASASGSFAIRADTTAPTITAFARNT